MSNVFLQFNLIRWEINCLLSSFVLVALVHNCDGYSASSKNFKREVLNYPECDCGRVNYQTGNRIVGGREVNPHQYLFPVALVPSSASRRQRQTVAHFCGGSIICPTIIMTAAHCVYKRRAADIGIIAGDHNLNSAKDGIGQYYSIVKININKNYNPVRTYNDIALLELGKSINLDNKNTGTVCLPSPNMPPLPDGFGASVMGWGLTSEQGRKPSNVLREVEVNFVANQKCQAMFTRMNVNDVIIKDNMLCFGEKNGGKDACQGDSGGPLVFKCAETGRVIQIGIVSFGIGCANRLFPGVYTNVVMMMKWVQEMTQLKCSICTHDCNI